MVRFVANDLETAIDLLQQDDAYHLMGEGHGRKGKTGIAGGQWKFFLLL